MSKLTKQPRRWTKRKTTNREKIVVNFFMSIPFIVIPLLLFIYWLVSKNELYVISLFLYGSAYITLYMSGRLLGFSAEPKSNVKLFNVNEYRTFVLVLIVVCFCLSVGSFLLHVDDIGGDFSYIQSVISIVFAYLISPGYMLVL